MLSKRPRPIIGKLSELLISGRGSSEFATSPRSPLDLPKMQSPSRGLKKYDHVGGVGLGIVAALEKSGEAKYTIRSQSLCRTNPIPMKGCGNNCVEELDAESLEDYTIVTCHGPDKSFTKVYHGGVVEYGSGYCKKCPELNESDLYPTSSFLSWCHLCRKNLHGKDIYMYRGEKGFCSEECRAKQMVMDERKEMCRWDVDVSSSPHTGGHIFSAGITAI